MFTALVLLSALLIEVIGTYVSVIGLSHIFSSNPIIIVLAVALDIAKLVSVSFLYKNWKDINVLMKSYMTTAVIVLMLITSAGAFGFLSAEFQKAISTNTEQTTIIKLLSDEQARLNTRKKEIDKQISNLPNNFVRGRTQLMKQFEPELAKINDRLQEIDKELPQLQVKIIKTNVEIGPILYIAEAFDITPEKAVKWVILTIIFVFDPLAIALLLAANFLALKNGKNQKNISAEKPKEIEKEPLADKTREIKEPVKEEKLAEEIRIDEDEIRFEETLLKAESSLEKIDDNKSDVTFLTGTDSLKVNRLLDLYKNTK